MKAENRKGRKEKRKKKKIVRYLETEKNKMLFLSNPLSK